MSLFSKTGDFYRNQTKVFPWLKVAFSGQEDSTATLALPDEMAPVCLAWLGDLLICYVEDAGDCFRLVSQGDLPAGFTKEQLHELAVENLQRDVTFRLHQSARGFYGLIAGGNHESGAICLLGIWEELMERLEDDLVVAIPARDLLLFAPVGDEAAITNVEECVAEIFANGERLLSRQLFRYDKITTNWSI